ncbi:MAG: hypothetical protein K2P73_14710 [Lachnospiraceae bacterium]|nr:hypothetical protein [Lachnospiraceae bacterium]
MGEIKRTLKTMPNFKTNSPHDFFSLDYSLTFFLQETQCKLETATDEFRARIAKILDDDRTAARMFD